MDTNSVCGVTNFSNSSIFIEPSALIGANTTSYPCSFNWFAELLMASCSPPPTIILHPFFFFVQKSAVLSASEPPDKKIKSPSGAPRLFFMYSLALFNSTKTSTDGLYKADGLK